MLPSPSRLSLRLLLIRAAAEGLAGVADSMEVAAVSEVARVADSIVEAPEEDFAVVPVVSVAAVLADVALAGAVAGMVGGVVPAGVGLAGTVGVGVGADILPITAGVATHTGAVTAAGVGAGGGARRSPSEPCWACLSEQRQQSPKIMVTITSSPEDMHNLPVIIPKATPSPTETSIMVGISRLPRQLRHRCPAMSSPALRGCISTG